MPANKKSLVELSCLACKRLKRKCSREVPKCLLCQRTKRSCQYPGVAINVDEPFTRPISADNVQSQHLESSSIAIQRDSTESLILSNSGNLDSTTSVKPTEQREIAMVFLDSVACRGNERHLWHLIKTRTSVGIGPSPLSPAEVREETQAYNQTIHSWLPIISKYRLERLDQSVARSEVSPDDVLLLLTLRMINRSDVHEGQVAYLQIKTRFNQCISWGIMSANVLASSVMIATYEFGHAIFPAAYMTTAECSRLAYMLGIHDTTKAVQLIPNADTWYEREERRRLWWATMILDRCVTIGFRFRPLCTSFLPSHELLPADDDSWSRGEPTVNPSLVMSGDNHHSMSPYGKLCQASHLLGRVIQHINYEYNVKESDSSIHLAEALQIHRAAKSFLTNLEQEFDGASTEEKQKLSSTKAFAYSALLSLYDMHCCIESDTIQITDDATSARVEMQMIALREQRNIAENVLGFANNFAATLATNELKSVSPLLCECFYSAAAFYAWTYRESQSAASLDALNQLRAVLEKINRRWHVAGSYIRLLERTEYEWTGGCRF